MAHAAGTTRCFWLFAYNVRRDCVLHLFMPTTASPVHENPAAKNAPLLLSTSDLLQRCVCLITPNVTVRVDIMRDFEGCLRIGTTKRILLRINISFSNNVIVISIKFTREKILGSF